MLNGVRPVIVVVALATLAVAATAVVTTSSSRRADAVCSGSTPTFVNRFDASNTLVAREYVTYPGTTCDGNWQYSGAVLDPVTDGSCAYVYYLEPFAYHAQQGVSCATGGWSTYTYNDSIGTNSAFVSARPSYLPDEWKVSSGY